MLRAFLQTFVPETTRKSLETMDGPRDECLTYTRLLTNGCDTEAFHEVLLKVKQKYAHVLSVLKLLIKVN